MIYGVTIIMELQSTNFSSKLQSQVRQCFVFQIPARFPKNISAVASSQTNNVSPPPPLLSPLRLLPARTT